MTPFVGFIIINIIDYYLNMAMVLLAHCKKNEPLFGLHKLLLYIILYSCFCSTTPNQPIDVMVYHLVWWYMAAAAASISSLVSTIALIHLQRLKCDD